MGFFSDALGDEADGFNHRHNPPESADQGDSFGSSGFGSSAFGGGGSEGSPFGSSGMAFGSPTLPGSSFGGRSAFGGPEPVAEKKDAVERLVDGGFKAAEVSGKAAVKGTVAFGKSFSNTSAGTMTRTSYNMIVVGAIGAVISGILGIVSIFHPMHHLFSTFEGFGLSAIIGCAGMAYFFPKAEKEVDLPVEEPVFEPVSYDEEELNLDSDSGNMEDDFDDEIEDEDEDDDWLDEDDEDEQGTVSVPEVMSIEEGLAAIDTITPGTQTRQYLMEQYRRILPFGTPDFNTFIEHEMDDDDPLVVKLEAFLIEAIKATSNLDEEILSDICISGLKENKFILEVRFTKPSSLASNKLSAAVAEFSNIYGAKVNPDPSGGPNKAVYAKYYTVGTEVVIQLFKGAGSVVVTLGDTFNDPATRNWFLDTNIMSPVVIGTNEMGHLWTADMKHLFSLLVAGEPRSGKSWQSTLIITQLAMFKSPRELVIYVCDLKDLISDYYSMPLPHIKTVKTNKADILGMLRWIRDVEAPRRKLILKENNVINYRDLIRKNPQAVDNMPELWLVIDEMMSLSGALDKDERGEFDDLLSTFVSQYPGLGMYFFGIPHRIVNDVIKKNVYELVPCRITVNSNAETIKTAIGASPAEFPYSLVTPGESAIKIKGVNNGAPAYSRGVAVTATTESTNDVLNFVRSIWSKLDHEYYHGPHIDTIDKQNGNFDNYECGCKSRGGVKAYAGATGATTGKGTASVLDDGPAAPILGKLSGGYVSTPPKQETNSLRRDNESIVDVFEEDDDVASRAAKELFGDN